MNVTRILQRIGPVALSLALVLPSFLALAQTANAQPAPAGTIVGTVVSSDGAPVPGASVTLQGSGDQSTTSDAAGRFRFVNVPPVAYTIVLTKAGFYSDWKKTFGSEAWDILEKSAGRLA